MNTLESQLATLSSTHKKLLLAKIMALASDSSGTNLKPAPVVHSNGKTRTQLVAYFSEASQPKSGADTNDVTVVQSSLTDSLHSYIKQQLPVHLHPAVLVPLNRLPRLPNGKVSLAGLPDPTAERTPAKQGENKISNAGYRVIADVLGDLLCMDDIRPTDNFFELGGDSITAIQFVSKVREAGIKINIAMLANASTLGELASQVQLEPTQRSKHSASGLTPLTPIQAWFFSQKHPHPEVWNLANVLTLNLDTDLSVLKQAVLEELAQHPALGSRFEHVKGVWTADIPEGAPPIDVIHDHSANSAINQQELYAELVKLQADFELATGWMIRFFIYQDWSTNSLSMAWIAHHLVIDPISSQVLLSNIEMRYQSLLAGTVLPASVLEALSIREWAHAMAERARHMDPAEIAQANYPSNRAQQASTEHPSSAPYDMSLTLSEQDTSSIRFKYDGKTTKQLLDTSKSTNIQVNDLLLSALSIAWQNTNNQCTITFDIESHGRHLLDDNRDNSASIGWFTSFHPLLIQLDLNMDQYEIIKHVKEHHQKASVDLQDYVLLTYCASTKRDNAADSAALTPTILFNYMGKLATQKNTSKGIFLVSSWITEPFLRAPENKINHLFEINTYLENERLCWYVRYSNIHMDEAHVNELLDETKKQLHTMVRDLSENTSPVFTPSDFPDLQMDQQELDSFLDELT